MTLPKSKLVLGTVQLGMKYGIHNTAGQPSRDESFAILDTALSAGIDTFDTARSYGDAENMIGEWIRSRGMAGKVKVISKMWPKALEERSVGEAVADIVCAEIRESLARLRIDRLNGYLLHTADHVYRDDVLDGLRQAKREGLVEHIGISIYDEPEALEAARCGLEYVQVPYNAFDQRLDRTDFFELAEKAGVVTFARSPFLQGLLLMEPDQIPPYLAHARPLVETFADIAKRYRLTPLEAAFLFAYRSRASYVVFGAETNAQLKEILAIGERLHAMTADCVAKIRKAFSAVDRAIVNPSLWNRT